MKNKGFTLIELLAVIVILAIIALIATPIILNIIEDSRNESFERSGEQYLKAANNAIAQRALNDSSEIVEAIYSVTKEGDICLGNYKDDLSCVGETLKVSTDGTRPTSGEIYIRNSSVKWANIVIGGRNYENGKKSAQYVQLSLENLLNSFNADTNGKKIKIGDSINYDHRIDSNDNEVAIQSYTSYSLTNASSDKNQGRTSGYINDQVFNVNSYTGAWKILGIEDEKITLISEDVIIPDTGGLSTNNYYVLAGPEGYRYATVELDAISSLYAQGKYAEKGRSIKIEDVDKITGYNPKNYGVGKIYEYGNKISYYWDGTSNPYYESENGKTGKVYNVTNQAYIYEDTKDGIGNFIVQNASTTATEKDKQFITTLEQTYYEYYPITLNDTAVTNEDIANSSAPIKLLFQNTDSKYYWLATKLVRLGQTPSGVHEGAYYSLSIVHTNQVTRYATLSFKGDKATNPADYRGRGIRAIITLDKNIELSDSNSDGVWEIIPK